MKAILFVPLIVLVSYQLEFSEAGSESARNSYVDVDGESPEIRDLAEFAAEETGYKLISVGRVGKKTVRLIISFLDSSVGRLFHCYMLD